MQGFKALHVCGMEDNREMEIVYIVYADLKSSAAKGELHNVMEENWNDKGKGFLLKIMNIIRT